MSTLIRVPLADRTNSTQSNPSHSNTKIDKNAESHHKQIAVKSSRAIVISQPPAAHTPPTLTSSSPPSDVFALEPRSTRIPLSGTPIAQLLTDALTTLQPSSNQAIIHNIAPSQSTQPSIGEAHKSTSTVSQKVSGDSVGTAISRRSHSLTSQQLVTKLFICLSHFAQVPLPFRPHSSPLPRPPTIES